MAVPSQTPKPQPTGANANAARATQRVTRIRSRLRQVVAANQALVRQQDDSVYVGTGLVSFEIFLLWGDATIALVFPDATITLEGSVGSGFGIGESESAGAATFAVDPATLHGTQCTAQLTFAGLEAGGLVIDFYDLSNAYLGTFVGAGVSDGGGTASVTGTWS